MSIRDLVCVALTIGLATTGCGKEKEDAPAVKSSVGGGGSESGTAAGTATASSPGESEPPLPEVDKTAVHKVLDAWLAAQNSGDFAAYQALYADKLEGVKRVGDRTWRFDRKGWLADRERMFKKPMIVAMRDVSIGGSAQAPVVELVQSFKQGKFADEGPKRMVLTKSKTGLKIAREEMVKSKVTSTPVAAGGDDVGLWLTLTLDGKPYVVIDLEADDAWGSGRPRGPFQASYYYAVRDASKAPAAASWGGRELAVYGAKGERCTAKVGALALVGGGTPHFGEVQAWDGMDGGPPWSQAQRARAVYEMSGPVLVGALAVEGGCAPVVATNPASAAKVFTTVANDPARETAAIAAFRELEGYKSMQSDFVDNYEGKGQWAESPAVETFTDGTRKIIVVSAREGSGCGDFYGALTAIFEDKDGKLVLSSSPDQGYIDVHAVLDVEGDGQLDLIGAPDSFSTVTSLMTGGTSGYNPKRELSFPFNDCGC